RASRQGLTLSLDVESGVGDWVADIRKVKQVVINLLSNAVKFTPAGGKVTLRARRAGDGVEIAVIDTGVGIAPDQQDLVFEEFRQAGGDYLRKSEGTGLGLSLAKRFVELHGGTMRLESAPGRGSTFAFVLPLNTLAHTAAPPALWTRRAAPRALGAGAGRRRRDEEQGGREPLGGIAAAGVASRSRRRWHAAAPRRAA